MGGTLRDPRLFLEPTLEAGTTSSACSTYLDGALAVSRSFAVHAVEVWGSGATNWTREQSEFKEQQAALERNTMRRAVLRQASGGSQENIPGIQSRVESLVKEDAWMLELLGLGSHKWKRFEH